MFSYEICKIFKNTYFKEHLETSGSGKGLAGSNLPTFTWYLDKIVYQSSTLKSFGLIWVSCNPTKLLRSDFEENLGEVFVMLVVALPHRRFSIFIHCISTSSLTNLWAIFTFTHSSISPFCTFIPAHCRVIRDTFNLDFLGFSFYHERYGF